MKLLNASQVKQWDEFTIRHEPVASIDLMERAALQCTTWLIAQNFIARPMYIFCGKGNNGGDGLAIARQLLQKGIHPVVCILETGNEGSPDFQTNLERLRQADANVHFMQSATAFPNLGDKDIVIEALFGSGLSKPPGGISADLICHLNNSGATIISIDVPAGMFIDSSSKNNTIVKASHTLTFQLPKLCLLVAENSRFFGEVHVLDIGLHDDFLSAVTTRLHLFTHHDAKQLYHPRNPFSHKGDFGHALVIGGAEGKTGAAIIATELCLRSGAGLTSVHLLSDDYTAINARCPEAMTLAGDELVKKNLSRFTAIGAGPGLGTDDIAHHIVSLLLDNYEGALVLDADALNVIAMNHTWLERLPSACIITPHPKEFDRLFGGHADDFARIDTALQRSKELNGVIVLKGHHTFVAAEGEGFFNTTGNAGLAKGGSGDALTGIITALLAQKYSPASAAKLGVFLHGIAADLALQHQSPESLMATDIGNYTGAAFKKLSNVS